jgi:hypothetical protein
MSTTSITLIFDCQQEIELIRSEFRAVSPRIHAVCIRGKSAGAFDGLGSFQWTSGVRAVCSAFLRFVLFERGTGIEHCLVGGQGSLAASLDYALSKSPTWLQEMFGLTPRGGVYARRLFSISNPNRKRPGPVAVAVNNQVFAPEGVTFVIDGRTVTDDAELLALLRAMEGQNPVETASSAVAIERSTNS